MKNKPILNNQRILVFYDGKCGLCAKEISYYRSVAPEGVFDWTDVTQSSKYLKENDLTLSKTLKLLHVKNIDGVFHIGVDAFIIIWKQLRGWRFLGYLVSLPLIHFLATLLYKNFAEWRFKRLDHCQLAAENDKNLSGEKSTDSR